MTSSDIAHELRAARPVAPASLRLRVAAIAASTPPQRRSLVDRLLPRRRSLLVAVPVAAVLAVSAAGVVGVLESGTDDRSGLAVRESAADESLQAKAGSETEYGSTVGAGAAGAGAADAASTPAPTTGRAQRVTASLTIEVADTDGLSDSTQEALETTRSLGGYVVSVSYATGTEGSATMTLRVPTARVQEAITRLSGLGTIVAQQVQIDDLQASIDALDRRMANLRERIARLTAQIDQPGLDEETKATLVARRSAARAELAAARGDRAGHVAEARLATIQLSLVTDSASTVPVPPSRFDRAVDEAVAILAWEATAALYLLVLAGPLVLVAGAAWWSRRAVQRRQDERILGT